MTLKQIPIEEKPENASKKQKQFKQFNPGNRIKKQPGRHSLKDVCLGLVRFINRGSRYTYEQVDEIITGLQRSIFSLQQKKQEILKKRKK